MKLETAIAVACEGRALLSHCFDICEGGLGLELPVAVDEGALVSVSFYLPTSVELLELPAIVVHPVGCENGNFMCGLAFTEINATHRRLLRRYVNNRRFLHGDLRAPTDNADVGKRMTERLGKLRRLTLL